MFSNISLQLRIQEYTRNNILEVKSTNVHVSIISLNGGPYTFSRFIKSTFHTRTVYFPFMHQVSFQITFENFPGSSPDLGPYTFSNDRILYISGIFN